MLRVSCFLVTFYTTIIWPILSAAQTPQLEPTTWMESFSLVAADSITGVSGEDHLAPDEISDSVSKDGASGSASVTYHLGMYPDPCTPAMGGGPRGLVEAAGSIAPGSPVDVLAGFTIDFQFRPRMIATPPVTVTEVPISVSTCGSVSAGGDSVVFALAFSSIVVVHQVQGQPANFLANVVINASNRPTGGFPPTASFNFTVFENFPVDAILDGTMVTSVAVRSPSDPSASGSATADAFVDPLIEITDLLIPNTSERYRDYFDIEFSAGYFALGDPTTPTLPQTWGGLKTRY